PIGTAEAIESTSPDQLRRFYEDWYHPDRMAVVAVGDFDASDIESMISEAFGDIGAAESPRQWDPPSFEPPTEPLVASYTDEEATQAGVTVLWPIANQPLETVGDYQRNLTISLGMEILADRLSDDASSGEGALLGASVVELGWTRAIGVTGVDTEVRAGRADEGLEDVLFEVERIRRHGITRQEFDRAVARYATVSRQLYDQRETTQDSQFTNQIISHHLNGDHLMSPAQKFEVESDILSRVTRDDVNAAVRAVVERPPLVLVLGPDDPGLDIPGEDRIREVLASLPTVELEERQTIESGSAMLMDRPDPAPIANTTVDPRLDFTTLEFDNGATVYLWESDIAANSVFSLVEGFGGTSQVDIEDLPEAFLMTGIVGRSGVGQFDVPTLRRLLSDRLAVVAPWITETRQGLEASAASDEIETMFQLIHLTMTQPRFDEAAIDEVLDELTTLNASRSDVPSLLFEEAVNHLYYGDDPRYFVIPTQEQIDTFDVTAAERVFEDRFGNASDFAFVFVGDFDTDDMTALVASYIGTLPGTGEASGFVDHQPLPARQVQVATVEAGAGEQGRVDMFFTNPFEADPGDRLTARLVELIVSRRLRDRVREELSATYSIQAGIDLQRDPDAYAEAFIGSSGDPDGLDQIVEEVVADLELLQSDGPTDAEFSTAVEQLRDELDLLDNRTLANGLVTAYLYPDQPMSELIDRYLLLDKVTPDDVKELASVVFNLGQRIEVRQIPRLAE
ncbi:MAG TPA: insulinase family protein, partial [Acidimicrobiia bacterium]|nr:insulinase family protein [Acidimicrobiia bacterium]